MRLIPCLIIIFLGSSSVAQAAVLFNEIAWMGTEESHLCNWIELYNSGDDAIDITDWSLFINDTERPIAEGEGATTVLPAGTYFLLERVTDSCPNPLPQHDDWYLPMGNLPNSGATLRLTRGDGGLEDQVAGGEDWSNLGGDNDSKYTAQRTEDGWITAAPTPGEENASESSVETVTSTSTPTVLSATAPSPQSLTLPDTELSLELHIPEHGYVNQPIDMTVVPSGVVDVVQHSLVYTWNFGDTYTSNERAPTHQFAHPGTYVMTVHATYGRYEQVARHEITILPVTMSLTLHDDGRVQVHNDAPYEVDVSDYVLMGRERVAFPPHSIVLPNSSITVAAERLGLNPVGLVQLRDTDGVVVASNYNDVQTMIARPSVAGAATTTTLPVPPPTTAAQVPEQRATTAGDFNFAANDATATDSAALPPAAPDIGTQSDSVTTAPPNAPTTTPTNSAEDSSWYDAWPVAGLVVLLLGVAALLFYRPRHSPTEP